MSEYGTWNTHDSDVDTNLARSSLKQKPWTTNMNPELPRISPNTIVLFFLNLIVSFGFAGRVKWREAKGRRDQGTPEIGGRGPALIAVRGILYRWVAVRMGKMERAEGQI